MTDSPNALIGLDDYYADPRFSAYDGTDYTIAIIDSGGIDSDHPVLGPDANGDGVADRFINGSVSSGSTYHAMGVVGIAVGNYTDPDSPDGSYYGVARNANFAYFGSLGAAANWIAENKDTYNVVAATMSVTCSYELFSPTQDPCGFQDEVESITDLGVVFTAPVGNDYWKRYNEGTYTPGSVSPANFPTTIAVASVMHNSSDDLPPEESIGYFNSFVSDNLPPRTLRDPEITTVLAPGAKLWIAHINADYYYWTGAATSWSAPYVAGAATLAQQMAEDRLGRTFAPDEFQDLLTSTATLVFDGAANHDEQLLDNGEPLPHTEQWFPRLDVYALAEAIYDIGEITLSGSTLRVDGSSSDDVIEFTPSTGPGVDHILNLNGYEFTYDPTVVSTVIVNGNDGDDTLTVLGSGTVGLTLNGGTGNDHLTGGAGSETLNGGEGDDVYTFGGPFGSDSVIENGADGDTDTLDFAQYASDLTIDLADTNTQVLDEAFSAITLSDALGIENVIGATSYSNYIVGNDRPNEITGGDLGDTLIGAGGDDLIDGGAGDDLLYGGTGDDLLDGGSGNDIGYGGGGIDTEENVEDFDADGPNAPLDIGQITLSGSTLRVDGSSGDDVIEFTPSTGPGVDHILNLNGYEFTYDPTVVSTVIINGNDGDDILAVLGFGIFLGLTLNGGNGDDYLTGGTGSETLNGGDGDDYYTFGGPFGSDSVIESGADGDFDTLDFSQYSFDLNIELTSTNTQVLDEAFNAITLSDALGIENVIGAMNYSNYIVGNNRPNEITGGDLGDTLIGAGGDDLIDGGAGDDLLYGGTGDDLLDGGSGNDIGYGGGGKDTHENIEDVTANGPSGPNGKPPGKGRK